MNIPDIAQSLLTTDTLLGTLAFLLAVAVVVIWRLLRARHRLNKVPVPDHSGKEEPKEPLSWADRLTYASAFAASGIAAQGMFMWLKDVLGFHPVFAFITCTFVEVAMLASALRARDNLRKVPFTTGPDGKAVWVFAALSGMLSASHASTVSEASGRLAVTLMAGWLWERSLQIERQRLTGKISGIRWTITLSRLLIRLGWADPTSRDDDEIARERRIDEYVRAIYRLHLANVSGDDKEIRKATKVWEKAYRRAVEYARIDVDPETAQIVAVKVDAIRERRALVDRVTVAPPRIDEKAIEGEVDEILASVRQARAETVRIVQDEAHEILAAARQARTELTRTAADEMDGVLASVRTTYMELTRTAAQEASGILATVRRARAELARTLQARTIADRAVAEARTVTPNGSAPPSPARSRTKSMREDPAGGGDGLAQRWKQRPGEEQAAYRARVVEDHREEIRSYITAGEKCPLTWRDVHQRTGYKQRWCEGVLADARRGLLPPAAASDTADGPPEQTREAGEHMDRTHDRTDASGAGLIVRAQERISGQHAGHVDGDRTNHSNKRADADTRTQVRTATGHADRIKNGEEFRTEDPRTDTTETEPELVRTQVEEPRTEDPRTDTAETEVAA
ncbi:hypothetical protein GCM10010156_48870 [Planobispora rosea]|uniref:Uncharacterized protein n=1 Tax=Planobispora rosea TaxID=35762 RepID=A0A8J3SAR6_PLARO|nr:hypothetical protein [Planobispora rosea]GGS84484.1 hypothetical protein GCM10010156_48870 [Planobispora rosea]GIH86398.1 hypothetical protein Pro02_48060 [Planobispora rosea]